MPRWIIAGGGIALGLLGLALAVLVGVNNLRRSDSSPPTPTPSSTPRLVAAAAQVSIERPLVEWRAEESSPWQAAFGLAVTGNWLQTRSGGLARLALFEQAHLTLTDETLIQMVALAGQANGQTEARLSLRQGQVEVTVSGLQGFEIQTAAYTVRASQAVFSLRAAGNQSEVVVQEGQVVVIQGDSQQLVSAGLALNAVVGGILPNPSRPASPTPTASATFTASPTATLTLTPTVTASPSPTLTRTASLTASPTATLTLTPTVTASPSSTLTLSATLTQTPTSAATSSPIPTNTSRPSPSPTPVCVGRVTAPGGLFVRSAPDPASEVLLALPVDSVVNLLGQSISGNWYQISAPDVPAGGWMASNLLETSEDCRLNLPIAP